MTSLVVLPFKCKPWAFLLDYASQELEETLLLDLSKIQSWRWVSRGRREFQNSLAERNNFRIKKLGSSRSLFYAFLTLTQSFFNFRNSNEVRCKMADVRLEEILACRLSAFLGIRNFNRKETPFFEFAKHYLVAFRTAYDLQVFLSLEISTISRVVMFNGREPLEATSIVMADKFNLEVNIIEKGSDNSRYQKFDNSPHFHPDWWKLITESDSIYSENNDFSEAGKRFVELKLQGVDPYFGDKWLRERDRKEAARIPINENSVLFFSSSTTEYSPISRFNYEAGFLDQFEAVSQLAEACIEAGLHLVIRRHPNSVGMDGKDRESDLWLKLISRFPLSKITYVGPDVGFQTYANAKKARCVFVWKSSIGFETLALNVPTFALASAKWSWNRDFCCWSRNEINEALRQEIKFGKYQIKEIISKYANFMSDSGTKCINFTSAHKWGIVTLSNQRIYNGVFERFVQKIQFTFPYLFSRRG